MNVDLIATKLDEEIQNELDNLANLDPGSDQHSAAVESVAKLYKLKIEEQKALLDFDEKVQRREMEKEQYIKELELKQNQLDNDYSFHDQEDIFKKNQLNEQKKDRYLRIAVEAASLTLPLIFYAHWMNKGFKFEESGTYTSTTFRGLFNRFRPTKK